MPGAERGHPCGADPPGLLRGRVVAQERQGDVAVQAGEQLQHGRVVGHDDRAELVLGVALVPDQPLPVASQRAQLGQQRRGHRERPPMPVLMPQRVG
jgi:hypothetical protein